MFLQPRSSPPVRPSSRRARITGSIGAQLGATAKTRPSRSAVALFPLLVELERIGTVGGYWVGQTRELRRVGTWILDPADNAQRAPDWNRIISLAQEAERLWWGHLRVNIRDRRMRPLREEFYEASLHIAMIDAAQPRIAASRLRDCIDAILTRIGERTKSALRVAEERAGRPAVPSPPN
jgi:hypothetical protein